MLLLPSAATSVPGDPTPPTITPVYSPGKPPNGWFRGTVTLSWKVEDPESIILTTTGCGTTTLTADTAGTSFGCSATSDGGQNSQTVTIKLDKTVPSVVAVAERVPDANGWYNKPLTVSFSGTDGTSGLASCSAATRYGGPDNTGAAIAGSCTDNAGNVAGASYPFKYDGTAPTIFAVAMKRGNRRAQVTWRKSSDTAVVEVLRAPGRKGQGESVVYHGTATGFLDSGLAIGRKYEYRVAGIDAAANRSERKVDLVATGPLLSPVPGERVKRSPTLDWVPVRRATYYNLQIVRGRKVLSTWPVQSSFRLRRTWMFNGHRYRLRPGTYRWYVWPGYGRISASHYGALLGSSTFVVTR
jgi:hypothetical protein